MPKKRLLHIGWEEWIALPELGLPAIRAKVDTGAKTSALHAFRVEKIKEAGSVKIYFGIHPIPERPDIEIYCKAHLVSEREVTSSNGQTELRYVIRTLAVFGDHKWPIEITLTDRETMAYRMLIGRSAIADRLVVLPGHSYLLGTLSAASYRQSAKKRHRRKLHLCILSRSHTNYTAERLASVAQSRGHQVTVIPVGRCYVDISHRPAIRYGGEVLPRFDAVIPHITSAFTFYGVAVLRQFELLGTFCVNSSLAISHTRDRLFAHQLLVRAGISMPTTVFAHFPADPKDMIHVLGGAPLAIKLVEGPAERGVVIAQTNKAAIAVMQAFRGMKAHFIVQEYWEETLENNILCVIIGGKVVVSVNRWPTSQQAAEEETSFFNQAPRITLSRHETKLAKRAVQTLGLQFALVNLLRTRKGPKILDVNASPALKRLERITGLDVATLLIEYVETRARPRLPKRVVRVSS